MVSLVLALCKVRCSRTSGSLLGGLSKRGIDILLELQATVQRLESTVVGMDTSMKRLQLENARLVQQVDKAEVEVAELREDMDSMAERADTQEKRMLAVENAVEEIPLPGDGRHFFGGPPGPAAEALKQVVVNGPPALLNEAEVGADATAAELKSSAFFVSRQGILHLQRTHIGTSQACIRAVFIGLLGIMKKAKPPAPLKQGFWTVEDANDPSRVLRPQWDDGWEANREGWALEAVQMVRQNARWWTASLPQQVLDVLPTDVIESGLSTSFNTWCKCYNDMRDKDAVARLKLRIANRRHARKHIVSPQINTTCKHT